MNRFQIRGWLQSVSYKFRKATIRPRFHLWWMRTKPFEKWNWVPFRIRWAYLMWKTKRLFRKLERQIGERNARTIMGDWGK